MNSTKLIWTSDKPKVEGWYFFRPDCFGITYVIHTDEMKNYKHEGQFAGPIPEPEEG